MSEKSLKKNAFYSFLKAFMTLIFPIITFPYASRILTPEGIGKINFANSIVSYFVMFGSLGIGTYAVREITRNKDNQQEIAKTVKEILSINFISTIFSLLLFFVCLFTIPKFYEYKFLLLVCGLNIFFTPLGMDWYYRAKEDFKYITIRSFIFQVLSIFFLFIFIKTPSDLYLYAFVGIISSVGSNLCNIIHARKIISLKIDKKLELKKHLKYIFIFFSTSISVSIYTMLDTTMVGFFSNNTQVGYYTAANKINRMILGIITAVIGVLLPRLSYYTQNNKQNKFNELANKSFKYITILSLPCFAGLILLSEPIVILFSGKEYTNAIIIMKVLSPLIFIVSLGVFINSNILPSLKKEKYGLLAVTIGAFLNFTLNIIFIKKFQALGAGISTLITESVITIIQLLFTKKIFINKQNLISLLKVLCSTVIMYFFLKKILLFIPNNIFKILTGSLLGIIIYALLLYIFREIEFLNLITQIKQKLKFKSNDIK